MKYFFVHKYKPVGKSTIKWNNQQVKAHLTEESDVLEAIQKDIIKDYYKIPFLKEGISVKIVDNIEDCPSTLRQYEGTIQKIGEIHKERGIIRLEGVSRSHNLYFIDIEPV